MVSAHDSSGLSSVLCSCVLLHPCVSKSTEERNAEGGNPAMDQRSHPGERKITRSHLMKPKISAGLVGHLASALGICP